MELPPSNDTVTVWVPPRAEFMHVLRAVTASVASRLRIPYDGIEDLRLAVDEAGSRLLLARGADARSLGARLEAHEDRLEVVVTLETEDATPVPPEIESTLTWRLLVALVDAVRTEAAAEGPCIRLVKRALDPRPGDG